MTTGHQDASLASGLRQVAPSPTNTRWVTLALLAMAGLTLLAYFQPLPVLLLVVGLVVVALSWARPFWVFAGLLALLPFHEQMLRVVTWQLGWTGVRVTALSLWKEAVIALLLVVLIVQHVIGKRRIQAKLYQFDLWLLALVLFSGIYVAVAATPSIGLFGFRNYFEPLAVFFLARLLLHSRKELKWLLIVLSVIAAGVAAFGIYQALAIDFPTMIRMGYVDDFGNLPFAFKTALADGQPRPRAISTVTGPNQLAMVLNLFILLAGYAVLWLDRSPGSSKTERRGLWRIALVGLIALYSVCLLLTYSRGGLLALAVSLIVAVAIAVYERGIKHTWRELTSNRLLMIGLASVLILAAGGLVASGFALRIWRGLSGADPAALGHVSSMDYASSFIASNPLGIGMGMGGPRALRFLGNANIQHTESTYLQFGMEAGLLGMVLLLIMLLSLLATLWRMRRRQQQRGDLPAQLLTEVALVTWAGALAVFIVTPLIQNFLVASYLWLIAGLAFHLDATNGQPRHDR